MRTPEEKEAIVLEYLNGKAGTREVSADYGISRSVLIKWIKKYRESGIEGLKSGTGKQTKPNAGKYNRYPSEVEKLKREILKKEIEIERLKKGYLVKGGGDQKEYVTTFDVNTRS
jgi:transposase-like protein